MHVNNFYELLEALINEGHIEVINEEFNIDESNRIYIESFDLEIPTRSQLLRESSLEKYFVENDSVFNMDDDYVINGAIQLISDLREKLKQVPGKYDLELTKMIWRIKELESKLIIEEEYQDGLGTKNYDQKSWLMEECGYSVKKGVSVKDRHKALECGLRTHDKYEIISLIKLHMWRTRNRPIMMDARKRWAEDIKWLLDRR